MSHGRTTIDRLSIRGFKSFADEVRIDILPGLTGIVGPNGCGKSNVVEALRWAMGESSARALRGGELDDLIFAGTGARPARNLAQVTLHLANATGLAPAPFQEVDELEVSRRAERGAGSDYRINGRAMRARDVQTLFADLASGARSSAIISQNRVGQLIAAKPEERRLLLEEAAGITGLHARRHDAELKLRQTENNLARAEDLRLQLEERLSTLEVQSGQARLYRDISERLRDDEARLQTLLHARADHAVDESLRELVAARATLKTAEDAAEQAVTAEFEAQKAAPQARATTNDLRAIVEHLTVRTETLRAEVAHARQTCEAAHTALKQAQEDHARSIATRDALDAAATEAAQALERTIRERATLPARLSEVNTALATAEDVIQTCSTTLEQAKREQDRESLRRDALDRTVADAAQRLGEETATLDALHAELAQVNRDCPDETTLHAARTEAETRQRAATALREALSAAERGLQEARLICEQEQNRFSKAEEELARFDRAEAERTARLKRIGAQYDAAVTTRDQLRATVLSAEKRTEMTAERDRLDAAFSDATTQEEAARRAQDAAGTRWLEARARAEEATRQHRNATRENDAATEMLDRQRARNQRLQDAVRTAQQNLVPDAMLAKTRTEAESREAELDTLQVNIAKTERALAAAVTHENETRATLLALEGTIARLTAECAGLEGGLTTAHALPDALEDHLDIPPPLARAFASALSDGLTASLPPTRSDRYWLALQPLTHDIPARTTQLSKLISAPDAVMRCLNAVFLLDDEQDGPTMQAQLLPGQALVGRSGALWRWDGFTRGPDAPDPTALRLEQRHRLHTARDGLSRLEQDLPAAQKAANSALSAREAHERALRDLRRTRSALEPRLAQERGVLSDLERRANAARGAFGQAQEAAQEGRAALDEAKKRAVETRAALDAASGVQNVQAEADICSRNAETARAALEDATTALRRLRQAREDSARAFDQAVVRHDSAVERLAELDQTIARLDGERAELVGQQRAAETDTPRPVLQVHQDRLASAHEALDAARTHLQTTGAQLERATSEADAARTRLATLEQTAATLGARSEALTPRVADQTALVSRLRDDHMAARTEREARPLPAVLERTVAEATAACDAARSEADRHGALRADLTMAELRLSGQEDALRTRIADLERQSGPARTACDTLSDRVAHLEHAATEAREVPERLAKGLAAQEHDLEQARAAHDQARAQDEETARTVTEAQSRRREADLALAQGREAVARLTERARQAQAARDRLHAEHEPARNAPRPDDLSDQAETALRRRISRQSRERDALGPVNLRAEIEYREARETADTIAREHAELTAAIARLRGGIGSINKEGRERLSAVFSEMDRHFQSLFTRMFGGGRAHLGLVGSDDPLEAGLEIFAQPPGKKLSTLSLLSGGEQALTALSLIFGTFRCNPAPICVLDEVDAPLDDANVERFCALLADMTREAGTRFMVVTHHQLTMAHMDRLFGVTMQERGVSRVLSVDLQRAAQMTGAR